MYNFILGLAAIFFIVFIIGMIKPQAVKMPNRKKAALVYFGIYAVLSWTAYLFSDKKNEPVQQQEPEKVAETIVSKPKIPEFKYPKMSLEEYRNEAQVTRQDIVKNYLASVPFDNSYFDLIYNCLSQMSYTKNTDLKLGEVLGWCKADLDRSVSALNDRVNLDNFMSNFAKYDGAYRPLEKQIKNDMNDRSSYSHVSTTYRMNLSAKPPVATVITTFTGKNQYNATVKQRAVAKVDLITGDMLSYDYQQ